MILDAALGTNELLLDPRPGHAFALGVRRVPGVPVVALRVWLRGGSRVETVPGQCAIAGRMLSEGAGLLDWAAWARRFEDRGMSLSSFGTREAHGLTIDALADDLDVALAWAAELVFESRFPEDRCGWLRQQALGELSSLGDQPEVRTAWAFYDHLYHPHPAGRPVLGTPAGLSSLRAEACREAHLGALSRGGIVTVAGEVDPKSVMDELVRRFPDESVPSEVLEVPERDPPSPQGLPEARRRVEIAESDQCHLYLGHLSVPLAHPDVVPLELVGVILGSGAGLNGRIPARVRESEGLAYTALAGTVAGCGVDPGRFVVYLATAPDTVERAEAAVREEIDRLLVDGVSEREVADASSYLLGREPFRRETARQWADLLADSLFYRLPLYREEWRREQLEGLNPSGVLEIARRHIEPERIKVTLGA